MGCHRLLTYAFERPFEIKVEDRRGSGVSIRQVISTAQGFGLEVERSKDENGKHLGFVFLSHFLQFLLIVSGNVTDTWTRF